MTMRIMKNGRFVDDKAARKIEDSMVHLCSRWGYIWQYADQEGWSADAEGIEKDFMTSKGAYRIRVWWMNSRNGLNGRDEVEVVAYDANKQRVSDYQIWAAPTHRDMLDLIESGSILDEFDIQMILADAERIARRIPA